MKRNVRVSASIIVLSFALLISACGNKPSTQGGAQGSPTSTPTSGIVTPAKASPAASPAKASPAASPAANPAAGKQWTTAPAMKIDANKSYQAIVDTNKGKFTIQLYAKEAPNTVNNFVFLSKEGYYNGVIFHRVMQSFMIQTGDPTGTGMGSPGYKFNDELKTPYKYEPGTVAMANSGPNTNGSQFFICTGEDSKGLPNKYTIFGKIVEGMDTIAKIAATPVTTSASGEKSSPTEKITINSIQIVEK